LGLHILPPLISNIELTMVDHRSFPTGNFRLLRFFTRVKTKANHFFCNPWNAKGAEDAAKIAVPSFFDFAPDFCIVAKYIFPRRIARGRFRAAPQRTETALLIGYARVSTDDQTLDQQRAALTAAGGVGASVDE
jgi:hypothetical protein